MVRAIVLSLVLAPRIVGGGLSPPSQDATVLLRIGDSSCTGTLVASDLVLTARHCVEEDEPIEVAVGSDAVDAKAVANGRKVYMPTGDGDGNDIALVALDRRIVEIAPAVVRTTKPAIGERAVAVGYGEDGDGAVPERRRQRANIRIDAVGPAVVEYRTSAGDSIRVDLPDKMIATGESTCFGDSGGPLFDEEGAVIGITSSGVDKQCRDRPSLFVGTYAFESLLALARSDSTPARSLTEHALGRGDSTHGRDADACATAPGSRSNPTALALIAVAVLVAAVRRSPRERSTPP